MAQWACCMLSPASQRARQLLVSPVMPSLPVLVSSNYGLQKWADQLREAKKLVTRRCSWYVGPSASRWSNLIQKPQSVSSENDVVSEAWKPARFHPCQKAAVREGPRRIREEKREAHIFRKARIKEFWKEVMYIIYIYIIYNILYVYYISFIYYILYI